MFARREAKTRIRQRDWLKLAGEKIRREQVGSVPTFLSVLANKFTWLKTGFKNLNISKTKRDCEKLKTHLDSSRNVVLLCLQLDQRFFRCSGTLKSPILNCLTLMLLLAKPFGSTFQRMK